MKSLFFFDFTLIMNMLAFVCIEILRLATFTK